MELETNFRGWVCCTERVEKRAPMGRRHGRVRVRSWPDRVNFSDPYFAAGDDRSLVDGSASSETSTVNCVG